MSRLFTIGLTGGIGSGKSAAAQLFESLGACIVDTDQIAHELTAVGGAAMSAILAKFGEEMRAPDGSLDRRAMRERVFSVPDARCELEAILHPLIRRECELRLAKAQGPYAVLVVPLLVETGSCRALCERVAVVDCPEALQIERVIKRSGLSCDAVRAVMAAQASREARLAAADDVIANLGTFDELKVQIEFLDQRYRQLASISVRLST